LTLRLLTSLDSIYRQGISNKGMHCERLCCLDQDRRSNYEIVQSNKALERRAQTVTL
jgi:hypothetical protein